VSLQSGLAQNIATGAIQTRAARSAFNGILPKRALGEELSKNLPRCGHQAITLPTTFLQATSGKGPSNNLPQSDHQQKTLPITLRKRPQSGHQERTLPITFLKAGINRKSFQ
jgi:hypothetical protein